MRKILTVCLALAMAFALGACGKKEEAAETKDNGAESFLRGTNPALMEVLGGEE